MTQASIPAFVPGRVPDPLDTRDHPFTYSIDEAHTFPASLDWTPKMPPVLNQLQLGCCVENAVAEAKLDREIAEGHVSPELGARLFGYLNGRLAMGTVNQDSGLSVRDGVKTVADKGLPPEHLWPYDISKFREIPPPEVYAEALNHRVLVYKRVQGNLTSIKAALQKRFLVVYGTEVFASMMTREVAKSGLVPLPRTEPGDYSVGGHCMLIVGWDDASRDGDFIVRNSWGAGWGQAGNCRIPYAMALDRQYMADFWVIQLTR